MTLTPKIFISATSGDLATARKAAAQALITLGCLPVEQSHFPPDARSVREMIREKIKDCQAVLHIAGFRYGAEPATRAPGEPRRSYTQMEFDAAVELGLPIYLFIADESFPVDPTNDAPEDEDRRALQLAHREALKKLGPVYQRISSEPQLREKLRELQVHVDELEQRLLSQQQDTRKARSRLVLLAAAVFVALGVIGGGTAHLIQEGREQKKRDQAHARELARTNAEIQKQRLEIEQGRKALDDIRDRMALALSVKNDLPPKERYERALEEVAFANKVDKDQLLSLIDKFTRKVESDPKAELADRARVAFKNNQFAEAARLGTQAGDDAVSKMKAADTERETQRKSALGSYTLSAEAEQQQGHYDTALSTFEKAAALTDEQRDPFEWAAVHDGIAYVLFKKAHYKGAYALLTKLAGLYEKHFEDPDNSKAATALYGFVRMTNALVAIAQITHHLSETEQLMKLVLEFDAKGLKPNDPEHARHLQNLATLYYDMNRRPEAESLLKQALAILETKLGPDDPEVARALDDLGTVYTSSGRSAEAEPLFKRALAIDEKKLGPDHPDVATALNKLGNLYLDTHRLADAEPLFKRALAIDEKSFGPDHPDVAISLDNLAKLYGETHRLAEAEPLYKRALAIDEKNLGAEHPVVAQVLCHFAESNAYSGRLAEAGTLFKQALAIDEKELAPDDPSYNSHIAMYAALCAATNKRTEAEKLTRDALAIVVRLSAKNGHENPGLQTAKENYITILQGCSLLQPAIQQRVEAVLRGEDPGPMVLPKMQVVVKAAVAGGQAAALGLQAGDIILRYAGQEITSAPQFIQLTGETKGDAINLDILRGKETLHFQVKEGRIGASIEDRPAASP